MVCVCMVELLAGSPIAGTSLALQDNKAVLENDTSENPAYQLVFVHSQQPWQEDEGQQWQSQQGPLEQQRVLHNNLLLKS